MKYAKLTILFFAIAALAACQGTPTAPSSGGNTLLTAPHPDATVNPANNDDSGDDDHHSGDDEHEGGDVSTSPTLAAKLTASSTSITRGSSVTLQWSTAKATTVTLSPPSGYRVSISGSKSYSPTSTTTYVLTARNYTKSVSSQVTVTVNAPSPTPKKLRASATIT